MNTIVIKMSTSAVAKRSQRTTSDVLATLLGSRTRAKLLAHFVLHPGEEYHVRELERQLREPAGNLLRDLRRFYSIGFLETRTVGNQVRYRFERRHPLYEDLQRLALKTAAPGVLLKEALSSIQGVELAFIYGSFAKGTADTRSDLDVMVIGDLTDKVLAPAIAKAERRLGRAVSYTHYRREEAKHKARQGGSFLRSVLQGAKILLIGNADDELLRATR